jgi:hypothetical protein
MDYHGLPFEIIGFLMDYPWLSDGLPTEETDYLRVLADGQIDRRRQQTPVATSGQNLTFDTHRLGLESTHR